MSVHAFRWFQERNPSNTKDLEEFIEQYKNFLLDTRFESKSKSEWKEYTQNPGQVKNMEDDFRAMSKVQIALEQRWVFLYYNGRDAKNIEEARDFYYNDYQNIKHISKQMISQPLLRSLA
jgi:hypothetical protein